MADQVVHFGWDDCYRVQVLQSAGYEVKVSACLEGLCLELQHNERVVIVVVSEDDRRSAEQAAEVVRRYCTAPLILFWRNQNRLDESKFDRVFASFVQPQVWLDETAALIEQARVR